MEKLRKIGQWLWLNKERMVLGGMILVFAYRVYLVAYPQETVPSLPVFATPREGVEPLVGDPKPEPIPPPPPPPLGDLVRNNMFWVYARDVTAGTEQRQQINLRLRSIIRNPDGTVRANLYSNRNNWVRPGDQFETFIVREINADEEYVIVYSEQLGEEVRLNLQS